MLQIAMMRSTKVRNLFAAAINELSAQKRIDDLFRPLAAFLLRIIPVAYNTRHAHMHRKTSTRPGKGWQFSILSWLQSSQDDLARFGILKS
jgi:hypothetical protein